MPERPEMLRFDDRAFELPAPGPLRHRLSNGAVVYVVEDRTVPIVDVTVALPIGDVHDSSERPGLASLTALMLRRGGAGERDADAFDEQADYLALRLNSTGGSRRSGASLNCTAENLGAGLDLLADLLLRPRFQQDRLDLAKANLTTSIAARNDEPLARLRRRWQTLMYGDRHPLGRVVETSDVEAIGRRHLVRFHRRHWRLDHAVIAVSGDVNAAEIVAMLDRRLGGVEGGELPRATAARRVIVAPGIYVVPAEVAQAKVLLGHLGYRRSGWDDRRAYPMLLMAEILGGSGPVSRLRGQLRAQRGLVYRVQSSYGIGSEEPGTFEIFVETAPEAVAAVLAGAIGEIERLRAEAPPPAELELARRVLIDRFPLLFETAKSVAGRYAEDELLGRDHRYWQTYRGNVSRVSAADVQRAAGRQLRPDQLRVLVLAPRASVDETALSQLGLGEVVWLNEQ